MGEAQCRPGKSKIVEQRFTCSFCSQSRAQTSGSNLRALQSNDGNHVEQYSNRACHLLPHKAPDRSYDPGADGSILIFLEYAICV
jgi:hypothetical protein